MGDLLPIGDVPGHYARQFGPDRWALEHNGEVMTWAELERRANRRAWALAAQGVRDDDIVMLSLPNGNYQIKLRFVDANGLCWTEDIALASDLFVFVAPAGWTGLLRWARTSSLPLVPLLLLLPLLWPRARDGEERPLAEGATLCRRVLDRYGVLDRDEVGASLDAPADADGTGGPDFLDTDSDNDCAPDSTASESGAPRTMASAMPDSNCTSPALPVCNRATATAARARRTPTLTATFTPIGGNITIVPPTSVPPTSFPPTSVSGGATAVPPTSAPTDSPTITSPRLATRKR